MITLFSLTERGERTAKALQQPLEQLGYACEFVHKAKPFIPRVQQIFTGAKPATDALIFICATGIVMRALAPVLQDKYRDAPVLVLDENGAFVIPLLSGHEGGANQLAAQLAALTGAQAVLTSAHSYLNPAYCVGMGCERNCPTEDLYRLLLQCLDKAGLTLSDVQSISSIDIKADETGLIALAEQLGVPFYTWSADRLRQVEHRLNSRSDYVFNTVGVYGVAESAALYSADRNTAEPSELLLAKHKNARATCAIARYYQGDLTV